MAKVSAQAIAKVILERDPLDLITAFHTSKHLIRPTPEKRKWHELNQEVHFHKLELHMVLTGQEDYGLNGKIYRLTPGTILLANFGDLHDKGQDPDNFGTYLYLILYQSDVLWFTIQMEHQPTHARSKSAPGVMTVLHIPTDFKQIEQIKSCWHEAVTSTGIRRKLTLNKLAYSLHLLFLSAVQIYLTQGARNTPPCNSSPNVAISLVKEYLDAGLGKDITIRKLAAIAGYSVSHFQPLFKKQVGCTIHEYINRLRIEYLRLHGKNQPKKVLAINLGFKSHSAFSRWHRLNPDE